MDDYGDEDDKTQLVDLDALQGGPGSDEPQFAPPPTMDSMPAVDADDKTELFEIPASFDSGNSGGGAITSSAPDYGTDSFGSSHGGQPSPPHHGQGQYSQGQYSQGPQSSAGPHQGHQGPHGPQHPQGGRPLPPSPGHAQNRGGPPTSGPQGPHSSYQGHQNSYPPQNQHQPPPSPGFGNSGPPPPSAGSVGGNFPSVDSTSSTGDFDTFGSSSNRSRDQVVIPGGDNATHDGATAFVNLADFAEEKAHFTPEQQEAGYDGSTQFVDVNALMAGMDDLDDGGDSGGDPIENDQDLHRGYDFGPDDIEHIDDTAIIRAKNALGMPVILKRIWEGRPEEMTTPLRQRIAQLHDLKHPNLIAMNGMFVSDSGMWVELECTRGERLTRILQNGGPMDPDTAIELLRPVADVLELIHDQELAYANLTTDAIWVADGGKVLLEPFDMLKLEDRGNLGTFGPPEMNAPADRRQLSPASDVYSLAAVVAAAITGLPLIPQNLANYQDQKLVEKLQDALVQNPNQRPQSARQFIAGLSGKGEGPDIKIIAGAVFALLFLGVAVLALMDDGGGDREPAAEQATAEAAADEDPSGAAPAEIQAAPPRVSNVELPGPVTIDPRLTIEASFQHNPPADAITVASDDQLQEWRQEVDDLLERAEDASSRSEKLTYYSQALETLGSLIRKQEDPEDAWQTWREIYSNDLIQEEVDEVLKALRDPLLEGRLGSANRRYARLAAIDPGADARTFLSSANSATVVELTRQGADND